MTTKSRGIVYIIGSLNEVITVVKLSSLWQVLGFFLYQHLTLKKSKREASAMRINAIQEFWQRARILTRERHHCQSKVEKMFLEWRHMKKNEKRKSKTQMEKEEEFSACFDDVFDVAHADALNMMTIQEDKDFLHAQREKGRRGTMAGLDATLAQKEKRNVTAMEQQTARANREKQTQEGSTSKVTLIVSSKSSSESADESTEEQDQGATRKTPPRKKCKKMPVISPSLSAALDRTKISDRKAMMVVIATAPSLGMILKNLL